VNPAEVDKMSKRSLTSATLVVGSTGLLIAAALTAAPAHAAASSVLVSDDFSRSVASGFGTAETGGSYDVAETKNTSVNGSQAVFGLTASVSRTALVGPKDVANVEAINSFGISALPTAGSVYLSQMLRTASTGAHYQPRVRITPDKKISLGFRSISSASATTVIGSDVTLPFSMTANTRIMMRSQVEGSTLRAKAWAKGTSEPASWQVTTTSSALGSAGKSGVWAYLGGGTNPINVSIDDLKVSSLATPNVLPTAAFTRSVDGLDVALDAGGSADSDGTISGYAWDFGDGSTGTGKSPNKQYTGAGTYAVKLTVTDDEGGKASVSHDVTVVAPNVLPTAAFTDSVTDLAATFDAGGSADPDGTISGYAWDFGDGSTGTGKTSNRTYTAAGIYTVKLTVTDNRGGTATTTRQVTATNPAPTKPSAANTGVPAGTALTVQTGNLTITTPGTVIDGKDIRGYVVVKAPNVTIKRSIIRGGEAATSNRPLLAITQAGASNFLVEDVTVTPMNPTPYVNGINVNQSGTIRRANISGTVDGIMIYGDGVRVENSYLHDFVHYLNDPNWGGGPSHDDAIQVQAGTGVQIVGNTLTGAFNAAVMVTQDAGTTKDLAINSNWLDYGGCSINYASNGLYKTGMQANNNRFGRAQRVSGCAIIHNSTKSDLVPTGNVWDDNGQPATIKKGA
jgi:PKD repeat protein